MARLASSLRRAEPDSVTLGGLRSEITKWRRQSAGDARSVDNMECSTCSHDSEPTVTPVSKKFKAKTVSFTSLMMALSRGERRRQTYEQTSSTSRKETTTFGRRARQRGARTSRNRVTPPQRRRDPALRPADTSIFPVAGCSSHLSFSTAVIAAHVSLTKSSTRRSGLDFALGDSTVTARDPHSCPHGRQLLARTSCDGGCECLGESEHTRNGQFILDQSV